MPKLKCPKFAAVMRPIHEFYPLLQQNSKHVVITMHQKPDGDAMGSTLALRHFLELLGHQVTVISPTNWGSFLNWLPGCQDVLDYEKQTTQSDTMIEAAEWIFCLDFNVLHRTKRMEAALTSAKASKILIDHHEQPQIEAFAFGVSNTSKSSTCEMIYDFIVESGNSQFLNTTIAECIYTGVMTDTGSFRFSSTTASVHKMVAHLKELGLNHTQIHDSIYDQSLENRLRFIGHALLNRMEVLYQLNTALMYISKADLLKFGIKTGETEGLVNYLLTIQGIKFGALVIDRDEERKWSFRSKGGFDANTFARLNFEGGGHFNAAGGRSSDSLEETLQKFKTVIQQYEQQLQ
jgi:bifunctional oligoribonuclease and PAP phosphatase NrnA